MKPDWYQPAGNLNELIDQVEKDLAVAEEKLQEYIEKEQIKVSCERGCTSCCEQKAFAWLMECFPAARHLLVSGKAPGMFDRLAKQSDEMESADRDQWWRMKRRCVFLDRRTRDCTIYPYRPSACRLYYVITPVELCGIRRLRGEKMQEVGAVNYGPLADFVIERNKEFIKALGWNGPDNVASTFPSGVMIALHIMIHQNLDILDRPPGRELLPGMTV